jgi:hypothetical protein
MSVIPLGVYGRMAGVDVLSQLFRDHNRMLVAYLTNRLRDMSNHRIREIDWE